MRSLNGPRLGESVVGTAGVVESDREAELDSDTLADRDWDVLRDDEVETDGD